MKALGWIIGVPLCVLVFGVLPFVLAQEVGLLVGLVLMGVLGALAWGDIAKRNGEQQRLRMQAIRDARDAQGSVDL